MKVIKRDGRKVEYDSDKIVIAISQANREVGGKDKVSRSSIEFITKYIESLNKPTMHVEEIQDIIERKLMEFGKFTLAKKYILYREKHAMLRQANSTDESILTLVRNANKDTMEENSNKNAVLVSTQRDLIAGECSKDLADRVMLPERIVKAHNDGNGAKYTRGRGPVVLRYAERCKDHSDALRKELQLKKLTREEKRKLCETANIKEFL